MRIHYTLVMLLALLAISGCASQNQMLDNSQTMAVQTAVNRGQFDLGCPSATGTVISREVVHPQCKVPGLTESNVPSSLWASKAAVNAKAIL
jgi:hypothetical protein